MCPHSKREDAKPETCSQCRSDVVVRRVDQDGSLVRIDGIPARPIDAETQSASRYYGKRGGRAMRGTRSKK